MLNIKEQKSVFLPILNPRIFDFNCVISLRVYYSCFCFFHNFRKAAKLHKIVLLLVTNKPTLFQVKYLHITIVL